MTLRRILNSTLPFTCSQHGQKVQSLEEPLDAGGKEGYTALLCKLYLHGTANHMGKLDKQELSPFIAQAENEGGQEFSPSCLSHPYRAYPNCFRPSTQSVDGPCRPEFENNHTAQRKGPTPASPPQIQHKPRKKRKNKQRGKKQERQKKPLALPQQETSTALQHIQVEALWSSSSSVSYSSGPNNVGIQETQLPDCMGAQHPLHYNSSSTHPWHPPGNTLLPDPAYSNQGSGEEEINLLDYSIAVQALQGSVCQEDRCFAGPLFCAVEKAKQELDEDQPPDSCINEGILFHPTEKLQPNDYEYREGRDYICLHPLQNGTFGDVYCVQDTTTRFKCAAKKIPLRSFRSEEVGSWSALNSPNIVQIFGAVREGPNVVLFMDLKYGSVGQLLKKRGWLPEDIALHYHWQVLGAIEELHRKHIVHLDIKADNVLLSEDGMDTYLCDFGASEKLLPSKQSLQRLTSAGKLRGTESHMAPEVVKGEAFGYKADVWSSCCMLLHMLNGCPPWIRYYHNPLFFRIANEPPPLREIPTNCSPSTADCIKAGLQKDLTQRASARQLREKIWRALKELGGLSSPVYGVHQRPKSDEPTESSATPFRSSPAIPDVTNHAESPARGSFFEEERDCMVKEGGFTAPEQKPSLQWTLPQIQRGERSETEMHKLEKDFYLCSLSQPFSVELQEQLLSNLSSGYISFTEHREKDPCLWSPSQSTDEIHSTGFSYRSQCNNSTYTLTPACLRGVDILVQDFDGHCLCIRETWKVKVGHIATGISSQISEPVFSLETWEGKSVSYNLEVPDSGMKLRCISAPNICSRWSWRVRDGVLEVRD